MTRARIAPLTRLVGAVCLLATAPAHAQTAIGTLELKDALPAFIAAAPGFESLRVDSIRQSRGETVYSSRITPEGFQPCDVRASGQVVCLTWEHDQYDYSSLVRAVTEIVGRAPDRANESAKSAVWDLDRVRIDINEFDYIVLSVMEKVGR